MHELSLCKSILDIVHQKLGNSTDKRIIKICLEVGELLAIDASALTFNFKVISEKTRAQGAILEMIFIPGEANCDRCHYTVNINAYGEACKHCGSLLLSIIHGEELRVKSMEIA